MNFFFGFKNEFINCKLTIPKFQNSGNIAREISVFSARPSDNNWQIDKLDPRHDNNFYFVDNNLIENDKIFFLSDEKIIANNMTQMKKSLMDLDSFTNTKPIAFRSNLKLELKDGGFSSYQSDYPFSMINKSGSIASPLSTLLNKDADKNFIILKNIFHLPIQKNSNIYFLDLKKKTILDQQTFKSNTSNIIRVDNDLIDENTYILTEKFLGIPIYVSIKNKHMSMEHTHPPHHYILGADKFYTVSKFKKKLLEIVEKK